LKLAIALVHPYILTPHPPFSPYLLPCAWTKEKKRGWKRERVKEKKGNRKKYKGPKGVAPPFSLAMAEQDWTPFAVTLGHLQKLVKHQFRLVAELEARRVPEDPRFPSPAEGYVVSFMALYEWGFSMPLHQFLPSLLWYFGLELHHITPLGVLHIAGFVTLCEDYLGIDPDLNLSKYFFGVHHPQDPKVELMISGGTTIHVKLGHWVDS
jgi:hypothetical protein